MSKKIAIYGIAGRMGKRIASLLIDKKGGSQLYGAIDSPGAPHVGEDVGKIIGKDNSGVIVSDNIENIAKKIDVVIDFSTPDATSDLIKKSSKLSLPTVIGTTGLTPNQIKEIEEAAKKIPVLMAPNMSMGINLLSTLVEQTSKALPADFQIEIIEAHHKDKVDSPSGTAIFLGKSAAKGRGLDYEKVKNYNRAKTGKRKPNEIGIESIRGGDVVGEHSVFFIGQGERIELTHRALSRDTFASGAIKAAEWLVGKSPGLYDMLDVLNLKGRTQ